MAKSADDPKRTGGQSPVQPAVKRLTPRPRAASWSPPAKRVTLPSRDPRKGRGR
jgi:hypothetical protein